MKIIKTNSEVDKDAHRIENKWTPCLYGTQDLWCDLLTSIVRENKNNPKGMFKAFDTALHRKQKHSLLPRDLGAKLANKFCDTFDNKICLISNGRDSQAQTIHINIDTPNYTITLTMFIAIDRRRGYLT